jgi:catechol 2,3-dioxygenase-like lactoylglutathione lyase family enzyme
MVAGLLVIGVTALGLGLIGSGSSAGGGPGTLTAFRVRTAAAVPLNADHGWAKETNGRVVVDADRPFRMRIEVEVSAAGGDLAFRLEYRRNGSPWEPVLAEDFPKPEQATPRVSVVSSRAYEPGTATIDLLAGASLAHVGGAGLSLSAATPRWAGGGSGEWEWPLVIRRYADGPVSNEEGDTFEFRVVTEDGTPLETRMTPAVALAVPVWHLGGTFVETPGRIGPWQASNGDLYFIMEPTETDNRFMVVKSSDGGRTWREADGANRPEADDLESVAGQTAGATIHLLHQKSRVVYYHTFRTSDHPTHPDTWDVRDDVVAQPAPPPTQAATIAVRTDGSVVAVYSGPEKLHLRTRAPAGSWGAEATVDAEVGPNLSSPQAALGRDGVVHLAYRGADGTAWYRRVRPEGSLTERVLIATGLGTGETDVGAILPLAYVPKTDTVSIVYRLATGLLWERRVPRDDGPSAPVQVSDRAVAQSVVDSDQATADVIVDGTTMYVLFVDEASGAIYTTHSKAGDAWTTPALVLDGINASWVRGQPVRRAGGARVYGFVFDAGSKGGSGMNRYLERPLISQ